MLVPRKWWPWLALVAILAVVGLTSLGALLWSRRAANEGFKGTLVSAALNALSPKERELFKNLQDNKYTTSQIDDMIQEGILNAKVVNKFLAALNVV